LTVISIAHTLYRRWKRVHIGFEGDGIRQAACNATQRWYEGILSGPSAYKEGRSGRCWPGGEHAHGLEGLGEICEGQPY
jgi:hypothetical protein